MTNCRHLSICPWIPVSATLMTRKGHWNDKEKTLGLQLWIPVSRTGMTKGSTGSWIPVSRTGMTPKTWCNSCTRILLTLLLILFPLLASSISIEDIEENCDYEYYPKLDSSAADELHVIKRNYYRYGKELKILADERIKEITLGTSDK